MFHRFLCLFSTHACMIFNWCMCLHNLKLSPFSIFEKCWWRICYWNMRKIVVWKRNLLLRKILKDRLQWFLFICIYKIYLSQRSFSITIYIAFKLFPLPLERFQVKVMCFKITDLFAYKIAKSKVQLYWFV